VWIATAEAVISGTLIHAFRISKRIGMVMSRMAVILMPSLKIKGLLLAKEAPTLAYGRVTRKRMNPLEESLTGVLSWTWSKEGVFWSIVVPAVVQPLETSSVISTKKDMSVALGFLGTVSLR